LKETIMERPANVVYPNRLQQEQEQSIGYVAQYAEKKRSRLHDITRKGKKYFPGIVKTFNKFQVPEELKVLIVLESDFNPNVISWAGAVGYWQFMDATAREYGLNIITREEREEAIKKQEADKKNKEKTVATRAAAPVKKPAVKKDDRKNLAKSTRAAARYLQNSLKTFNNDLLLTVASYNCGPGNVKKAQQRSGVENAGFWDIKECLPAETRNYVMNFIALNVLLNNYQAYSDGALRFKPETIKISELLAQDEPATPATAELPQKNNRR
ncbi:MAG: lytic transglycosylase domain-containing protein, partial [Dinghuibacter sp.]|nr:lytic transglycosylase domain-containing protein [Dinghuibacter sp.]